MKLFFVFLFLTITPSIFADNILQTKERRMMADEKLMAKLVEKYHPDEAFDAQVTSLRNYNTETKNFTTISISFKSLKNPEFDYEYSAKTRLLQFNKSEGKAMEIHGYYMISNEDLFKHERICGVSSCESAIYKNGKKIY